MVTRTRRTSLLFRASGDNAQRRHTTCLTKAESASWIFVMHHTMNSKQSANIRIVQPYMLIAQHNDNRPKDESLCALCELQANQGGYFLLNLRNCPKGQNSNSTWHTNFGVFAPICSSIFSLILQNELRKLQWNPPSQDSKELDQRDGGTALSSPRGQHR